MEFPDYRRYEATRQEANNALMALLAGSSLAAHTLQLTSASRQLLPQIFPGVAHIEYFQLRTDVAKEILSETGQHLGAVALPYALALHEDFVTTVVDSVVSFGYQRRAMGNGPVTHNRVSAWNMHEAVEMTLDSTVAPTAPSTYLELFHLLREMRNSHIHSGGRASVRLHKQIARMSAAATSEWRRLDRRLPADVIENGRVRFTIFDIFTVFAVIKVLGREINAKLRDGLAPKEWGVVAVNDYAGITPHPPKTDAWMLGLLGHVSLNYAAAALTKNVLAQIFLRADVPA
ncbi:hypothetical protein [Antrihabitans spumae]|uniref:RiboL-PSP-HEPN domain-containing protein n=1 Tax=Antrihabitans spumae TaxID=3373370 RepID=A0ABW7K8T5_9NOCA